MKKCPKCQKDFSEIFRRTCKECGDICPNCFSSEVWVGAFVLKCMECNWHYLNEEPCRKCGKPSTSGCSINGQSYYGCNEHTASFKEITNEY